MNFTKILLDYFNESDQHERKMGHYWASDLYPIIKGYLKPLEFFNDRKVNLSSAMMMATGQAMEDYLYKVLTKRKIDFDYQTKKEVEVSEGIFLTAKSDFMLKDCLIETKFPFGRVDIGKIPERYCYQLEAYYRIFKKPVYLGVISCPFNLTTIMYMPSERIWDKIKKTLVGFQAEMQKAIDDFEEEDNKLTKKDENNNKQANKRDKLSL